MKALLREDIIIGLTIDKGIEVGNIPNGVGLDRLRWNGSRLVDFLDPNIPIYVRVIGGGYFELHCIPVPNSQRVLMKYKDKKNLRIDSIGNIYIAIGEELVKEVVAEKIKAADFKLHKDLGDNNFQSLMAFVSALIVYAADQPVGLRTFFQEIAPNIKEAYPMARYEQILKMAAKNLNRSLKDYHAEVDRINSE